MRRIFTFNNVSADGYFTTKNEQLDWVVGDDEVFKAAAETMSELDTILFGRKTYEQFEGFWRHALDKSSTPRNPHAPGKASDAMREQAVFINDAKKIVFSRSLEKVTWKNAQLVHEFDPREIEAMKKKKGKDMIVFGSGSIASQLTQHDLIDEYVFIVGPTLIGDGRALISGVPKRTKLKLQDSKAFKSGNVMLRYARAK